MVPTRVNGITRPSKSPPPPLSTQTQSISHFFTIFSDGLLASTAMVTLLMQTISFTKTALHCLLSSSPYLSLSTLYTQWGQRTVSNSPLYSSICQGVPHMIGSKYVLKEWKKMSPTDGRDRGLVIDNKVKKYITYYNHLVLEAHNKEIFHI